jgi:hypothetical protein
MLPNLSLTRHVQDQTPNGPCTIGHLSSIQGTIVPAARRGLLTQLKHGYESATNATNDVLSSSEAGNELSSPYFCGPHAMTPSICKAPNNGNGLTPTVLVLGESRLRSHALCSLSIVRVSRVGVSKTSSSTVNAKYNLIHNNTRVSSLGKLYIHTLKYAPSLSAAY